MRINELNMFQNLLSKGKDVASNLAGQFRGTSVPNQQKVDKMARDMFINKFVSRGAEALSTAVQQKLVDPNSTAIGGSSGAAQPTQQPNAPAQTSAPATPAAPAAPAAGTAAPAAARAAAGSPNAKSRAAGNNAIPTGQKQGAAKPEIDQNVDKIVSAMRKLTPAGAKPLPPESKMAKEIAADMGKVALNKDYLLRVGDKILKANNAGYDVKDAHRQFMGQLAKGTKQKTIQESIEESRLEEITHKLRSSERMQNALKKAGYDPDLAIRRMEDLLAKRRKAAAQRDDLVDLSEVSPQAPAAPAQAAPAAGQQSAANPGKPSMGEWLKDNFIKGFFTGVPWESAEPQIDDILKRLPAAFAKGNVKKELTDIASIGWSLSPKRDA